MIAIAASCAWFAAADARMYRATPADYENTIRQLQPGDTLELAAGSYRNGLALQNVAGTARQPITIEGTEGTVFHARDDRSTISIIDASYIVIRNLDLEGDDLPVDAVKAQRPCGSAHDITLENLVIRGHGNNQQTVGISTKCPAWRWVIRGNRIFGAGTGIYLGDSDGSAPFVAGTIERNLIVDTIGYNLQIKHQLPRPNVPGIPATASTTIIRDNIFAKTAVALNVEGPRPNVLVGHFPLSGPGTSDRYAVYGNFFYQNAQEALFQGEGNIALYDNLFVNDYGDAVHIQPHNDIPRDIVVAFNTVVATGKGISVTQREGAPPFRQIVTGNMVFAAVPITGGKRSGNMSGARAQAARVLRRPFAPPGDLDLMPRRAVLRRTDAAALASLPDASKDFEHKPRLARVIGAYGAASTAPGWLASLTLKPASLSQGENP